MKQFLVVVAIGAAIIGVCFVIVMGSRYASNLTTQVSVVYPEPGVHCALASTGDGAALSCYPETWVKK